MTTSEAPLILAFVADLLFAAKIESAAQRLGFRLQWVDSAAHVEAETNPDRPGEPLSGPGSRLIRFVAAAQPALLIFDLGQPDLPWRQWLGALKSSPATRRFPVLCFGPHVDSDSLTAARQLGADSVVTRSRFSQALPDLLQQAVRHPDRAAVAAACAEPLAAAARQGIALFNAGAYFEAHEELELAWKADEGAGRELYRAILQVAVAYLQIERGNFRGALKMFLRVRQWLAPLPAVCRGVDVADLRAGVEQAQRALEALGEADVNRFDRTLFRPVKTAD